jgi:FkbM family methyltransferase
MDPQYANPWVDVRCRAFDVQPNRLPTLLQEQYGQLAEDLVLDALLKTWFFRKQLPLSSVRYAEVGANHPVQTSNTYLFNRKWAGQGVLVEANDRLIEPLRKVRAKDEVLHRAVVPPGFPRTVSINIAANAELSSIDANHVRSFGQIGAIERVLEVDTITLDEVLARFTDGLHLLSIDVEGLDVELLATARFEVRPLFIVCEPSRHFHKDAESRFVAALRPKGYFELARTDYNLIYADVFAWAGTVL